MLPYLYSALDVSREIRLLTLLPGSPGEHIHARIFQTPLVVPEGYEDLNQRDVALDTRIQRTLPPQWTARRTLEGDVLFHYADPDGKADQSSWTHPSVGVDCIWKGRQSDGNVDLSLPTYEALSYTWGSTDNPATVYIERPPQSPMSEQSELSTLQIGQHLMKALRYLRYTDKPRTLWIDAICIDQKNTAERNEQVKQMDRIYKLAERVIVWLGEESPSSKLAITTLEFLGRQVELTKDYHRLPSPCCDEPLWSDSGHSLPYSEETWEAIFDLLGRPWFSRLWILQEIQLGNRYSVIQCGRDLIEWRLFRRAISSLNDKKDGPSRELRTRMGPVNSMCWVRSAESVTALLNMARRRKCSEDHDKVYAILGLLPPSIAKRIHPDYSLPFQNAFKEVFLAYLGVVRRLDLMQRCDNQERLSDLPSWAPNWSGTGRAHPIYGLGLCASSLSSAHTNYVPPDILEIVGTRITTILRVESSEMSSLHDAFGILRGLGLEKLQEQLNVTEGTLLEAYAWLLCSGQLQDRFKPAFVFPTLKEWKELILSTLKDSELKRTSKEPYFWHWVQNYTIGRRIIRTISGYVGTAMGEAHAGMN